MSLPPVPKNWHWAKGTPAGGLHAWLGQLRGRVNGWLPFLETAASRMDELESRSGTSVTVGPDGSLLVQHHDPVSTSPIPAAFTPDFPRVMATPAPVVVHTTATRPDAPPDPADWVGDWGPRLDLPTHDGSGMGVHPSVMYIEAGWGQGGHKWWMAMTPYGPPDWTHIEDPNIFCSHDGVTWTVPAGAPHPLDDSGPPNGYNSDTALTIHEGRMYCVWRHTTGPTETIWVRTSTDGRMWTPRQTIFAASTTGTVILSPTLHHQEGRWVMWGVQDRALVRWTSRLLTPGTWSRTITDLTIPGPRRLWHAEVRPFGSGYTCLALSHDATSTGGGELHLAVSPDGIHWEMAPDLLLTREESHPVLYHSSLVPVRRSNGYHWWLYYSTYDPSGCWIHRTRLTERTPA